MNKINWDSRQKEFIFDHSGRIDDNGIIHFPKSAENRLTLNDSIKYPGKRTLMLSDNFGLCLIFESMHFVID